MTLFGRVEVTHPKQTLTAMMLVPVMFFTCGWACNIQNTVNTINSILAEVGPALQIVISLLPLLAKKNIPQPVVDGVNKWVPEVQKDVDQLQMIIKQYQSDLSSPDVQAKINAIIQTTENDVTSVLTIIHVLDAATQQKITAIVTAIGAAIISVENIINNLAKKQMKVSANGQFYKNGDDFKKKFNAVLHLPTTDPVVDAATAKLSL